MTGKSSNSNQDPFSKNKNEGSVEKDSYANDDFEQFNKSEKDPHQEVHNDIETHKQEDDENDDNDEEREHKHKKSKHKKHKHKHKHKKHKKDRESK